MKTLAYLAVLALVGCGSGGGGGGAGSCTADAIVSTNPKVTGITCAEYGASFTADQVKGACPVGFGGDKPGTYSSGACPTANRVGTCVNGDTTARYYSPGWTTALAKTACGGATFTPN